MIRVRVQNFQSIEDEEVVVDGLTVITGPNNSGKTAFMRAVKGVFTNAAPGPLVRHGTSHLSVSIIFDDGAEVVWEKGWEKPGRKGKTINRYIVNGVSISNVGRGVPPEVEQLGVREIKAASDRVWPQIAQQFEGALFLVNRPGSAVAEALSDVERVGKLTDALRHSEKDRRSSSTELKIRLQDLASAKDHLGNFEGLGEVSCSVEDLKGSRDLLGKADVKLKAQQTLWDQLSGARNDLEPLMHFSSLEAPECDKASKISAAMGVIEGLQKKRGDCTQAIELFKDFAPTIPNIELGDLKENLSELLAFKGQLLSLGLTIEELELLGAGASDGLLEAEASVLELLGERGICPTCDTMHEGVA
jgi:exonuclease SbcC